MTIPTIQPDAHEAKSNEFDENIAADMIAYMTAEDAERFTRLKDATPYVPGRKGEVIQIQTVKHYGQEPVTELHPRLKTEGDVPAIQATDAVYDMRTLVRDARMKQRIKAAGILVDAMLKDRPEVPAAATSAEADAIHEQANADADAQLAAEQAGENDLPETSPVIKEVPTASADQAPETPATPDQPKL